MDRVQLFTHGSNPFVHFKFPARRESVFELRLPEHWGSARTSRLYGESVRVHADASNVRWSQAAPHLARSEWTPGKDAAPWDREWRYTLDYEGAQDFLDIRLALTYEGAAPWDGESLLACMRQRMADDFIDAEGTRTWLFRANGPVTVNELVKGEYPPHRMMGAPVGRGGQGGALAHPLMATLTADGCWACAFGFRDGASCSGNFGAIHCIHANPSVAAMQPGEARVLRGRVYVIPVRGPQDALDRWLVDAL